MCRRPARSERVAVQSLGHQLTLALRLLSAVKEARETVAREQELIGFAQDAYLHSMHGLTRLPRLPAHRIAGIDAQLKEFRSALNDLAMKQ